MNAVPPCLTGSRSAPSTFLAIPNFGMVYGPSYWKAELGVFKIQPFTQFALIYIIIVVKPLQIVEAMGRTINNNPAMRTAFGQTPDAFQTVVGLYDRQDAPDSFLSTLSTAVSRLAAGHYDNQKRFVDAGILPRLVELGGDERRSSGDIQLTAVKAFLTLVDGLSSFTVSLLSSKCFVN